MEFKVRSKNVTLMGEPNPKAEVAFSGRDFSFSEIGQLSKPSVARFWQSRSKIFLFKLES